MLFVVHPAIGAVVATKAVFQRLMARIERVVHLGIDTLQVVWMNALAPEIRVVEMSLLGS
ncbi:MAG: hypothetical protein R3D01_11705 [Hyphomicrobiales bacterium]